MADIEYFGATAQPHSHITATSQGRSKPLETRGAQNV